MPRQPLNLGKQEAMIVIVMQFAHSFLNSNCNNNLHSTGKSVLLLSCSTMPFVSTSDKS